MALSKSTITGRVPLPSDENLQFAELTFALSGLDTEGASVLPGGVSTRIVLIDSDIPAGFELWQNTAGLHGTHYRVLARWTVKDRDGIRDQYADLGVIQIGSDPSYTLADLINNGVPQAVGTFWSALTQAQYDAVMDAVIEVDKAEAAALQAEAARDATTLIAATKGAYRDTTIVAAIAQGVAALTVGDTFTAAADNVDYIGLYKINAGPVAVEITRIYYPAPDALTPVIAGENGLGGANFVSATGALTLPANSRIILPRTPYTYNIGSPVTIDTTNGGVLTAQNRKVYFRQDTSTFVALESATAPPLVDRINYHLIAVIRVVTALPYSPQVNTVAMSCVVKINGVINTAQASDLCPIITPGAAGKLPDLRTATSELFIPGDTILIAGGAIDGKATSYVISTDTTISLTGGSTAKKIFYSISGASFVKKDFNSAMTGPEISDLILVAVIRFSTAKTMTISCQYLIDGEPPRGSSATTFQNRAGNAIEGIHHRGLSSLFPENTLAAYRGSAKAGTFCVEGDIRWSSDDVPFLMHDDLLDRTTNGTGAPESNTMAALKLLDAGSWKDAKFTGERIPTFEETMRLCKRLDLYAYMEIKTDPTLSQVQGLLDIVRRTGMRGRIEFDSGYATALLKVISEDPDQRVGYISGVLSSGLIAYTQTNLMTGSNRASVVVGFPTVTTLLVEEAHSYGIDVVTWTLNSSMQVNQAAAMGVDGIMSEILNIAEVLQTT